MSYAATRDPRCRARLLAAILSSSSLLAAAPAWAQQATPAPVAAVAAPQETGEIIVQARKSSETLSTTPLAVSATSGQDLQRLGVTGFDSIGKVAPNLVIDRGNGQTGLNIALRGVQDNKQGLTQTPGVAVILDGVQQLDPRALITPFFDVDHIEVLRGPQGTLYGSASPGGVVNVIANRPRFEWGGNADVELGNFDARRANFVINAPVSDSLAVRLATSFNDRDGYLLQVGGKGAAPVGSGAKALNAEHDWSVRGSVLWQPDGDTAWLTSATVQHSWDSASSTVTYPTLVGNAGGAAQRSAPANPITPDTNDWSTIVHSDLSTRVGGIALQLIGGFSHVTYDDIIVDNGGIIPPGGPGWIWFPTNGHTDTWSAELRLHNADPAPLEWTVGATYNRLKALTVGFGGQLAAPCLNPNVGRPGPGGTDGNACLDGVAGTLSPTADMSYVNTRSTSRITRESLASYGTLTYHATPALELTAGARLSFDRIAQNSGTFRFITNSTFAPYGQPGSTYYGNPCTYANIDSALCSGRLDYQSPGFSAGQEGSYGVVFTDQTYKAHKFTWKVGASWKPRADTVIYANIATGYKPGGFNPPSGFTDAPCCYNAENLVSYEIGIKARALDWLRIDSTAFYYNYGDQQVVSTIEIGNANFTSVTANASSRIWGVENMLTATPTRQDRLSLGINYLHATFRDLQAGGNAGNPFVDWSGVTLDKAPRWTISADYRHTFDIGSHGHIDVGVNTRYTSEYYLNVISNAQRYRQKPFHRTGADVTWTTQSGNFWLQGFVSNIEDKVQETFYQGNPAMIGNGNVGITEPRFYGLRLGKRF